MLDSIRRSPRFVISVALVVTLGAACKQGPPVDQTSGAGSHGAKEGHMVTSLLDQAATMSVEDYNPARIVHAVNALVPLGKEAALAQISSYLKTRSKPAEVQGLFWVLRVLFDVPAGQSFPPVRIGQPNIPPPADPGKLPRFPILIVRDIPFLVVSGYDLGGLPEAVDAHVTYFRTHGVLRDNPLTPPSSTAGIDQDFLQQWRAAYGDAHLADAQRAHQSQLARIGG